MVARGTAERRTLMSVDVRGYGSATGRRQASIQHDLIDLLDSSAVAAGLHREAWDRQKAGDGEFAVLPADESEGALLDGFVPHLVDLVTDYNDERNEDAQLRLRLAVHNGVVEQAVNGYAGAAAVLVGRLVDSAVAKAAQAVSPASGVVVIVSKQVFNDTIAQGHTILRARQLRKVVVQVKEYTDDAWLYVPGIDVHQLPLQIGHAATPPGAASGGPEATSGGAADVGNRAAAPLYQAKAISVFHAPVTARVIGIQEGGSDD